MIHQKPLSGAIRLALVAGAAFMASPVLAQTPESQTPETLDQITVTGTRIQSQTITESSPVTEISREDFQYSGATRVEDLLNTFPQLAPSFDSFTVNPTTGYATADLRGLGANRTLVLVNGHRLQPGGIRSEARDLNQIPAALVSRIDVLTGGASAVYGSDAMAGVVNFILDTEFEGVSLEAGYSGYQHKNRDSYLQGLMDQRGFEYPTGGSGLDGTARNIDIAVGSGFADGRGHAMAYLTYRENNELRQGERDYSSCALNAEGTVCGGSSTSPIPSFLVFEVDDPENNPFGNFANIQPDGSWAAGPAPLYNYAPINHYQRPDERWNFGSSVRFEVNPSFRPYLETMVSNTQTSVQIAESGTFFVNLLELGCDDPLIGTLCTDLGINPANPVDVYVGKRNNEGGPRISAIESTAFRVVTGVEGDLGANWAYNASFLYGRNSSTEVSSNDFLADRVGEALLQCPPGSSASCVPYNVWVPGGGVTPEAAAALSGVGVQSGRTSISVLNAYATGELGFGFPSANAPISLVVGTEWREETYAVTADSNMATGNFTGLGGPLPSIDGKIGVKEIFLEAGVPLVEDAGFLRSLALDLGYRYSDYDTSGTTNTYKIGFISDMGTVRARGGYNRAIRAANTTELFSDQGLSLWGGSDPCAGSFAPGATPPEFTAAQCANTGVTAAQYGNILRSPAAQYNQFTGGNPDLTPEKGDTWTLGFVVNPFDNFSASLDYYDIKIEDQIGTIGSATTLRFCGLTGDPFLCDKVNRGASGDLWIGSNPETSGFVENLTANFGEFRFRGLDLTANYGLNWLGGRFSTSFVGTRVLEATVAALPGVNDDATYDCKGTINISCQSPDWRHTASVRFSRDWYTASLRWRHIGSMDYTETDGTPGAVDQLLIGRGNRLGSWNYIDLSGSVEFGRNFTLTAGVNNIADKAPPMVGADLALNANAPGGYDQLGRFFFTNLGVRF